MKERIDFCDFENLQDALQWDKDKFPKMLEKLTGIIAKPYIGFAYYDAADNFIGDSEYQSLSEILEEAEIEVSE